MPPSRTPAAAASPETRSRSAGRRPRRPAPWRTRPPSLPDQAPPAERPGGKGDGLSVTTGLGGIAVGTALVVDLGRPPHGSERAGLPHSALALGTSVEAFPWVRMKAMRCWDPSFGKDVHARPSGLVTLAPAPKRAAPVPDHPGAETTEPRNVHRYRVVREVSAHHGLQPLPLLMQRQVALLPEILADRSQLRPHSLLRGAPEQPEFPFPRLGTDVRVSRPGEFHPQPLSEPYLNVSAHTAPIKKRRPPFRVASVQTETVAS